jgi:colanic acid biosynthesis glycosyl transferase WcaI
MNKKRILLIGGNFSPELTGIGKYNGEMIEWLASHGYECAVVTTFPYYPQWHVQDPYGKSAYWYKTEKKITPGKKTITIYRCPHYIPRKPTGIRRMISDASFFLFALLRVILLLFSRKYEVVITVVPAFHIGLLGMLYKKIRGAAFLYHIQDLQIEAAQQLGMIPSRTLIKLLYKIEAFILQRADLISTISEGMIRKIKAKCSKNVFLFQNWVDTNLFYPIAEKSAIKELYGFKASDKIILYSGAIGEKQGLEIILQSAKALKEHLQCHFVICGSGPYKEKLETMKREMSLSNVSFLPLQPFEKLNKFLNMADVHLVLQKADAADLVMPSKLTTILAIGGLSLVTAKEGTSLHDIVSTHSMGILIEPEDQATFNTAILQVLLNDFDEIKENARNFAKNNIAIDGILSRFVLEFSKVKTSPQKASSANKQVLGEMPS